jgi:hypothetical protein
MLTRTALVFGVALSGCATTLDPNYSMQLDAYRLTITSQQTVEVARARAEEARYNAMAALGGTGDSQTRQMALLALALARSGDVGGKGISVTIPAVPENQEDKAYKWAALFAGPVVSVAQGYFGYRVAQTQSNNNRDTSIASYNSLGQVATAGFLSTQNTATAGFDAARGIAVSGFASNMAIGRAGFDASIRPNVSIIGGDGLIGTGTFNGPNQGNSGVIGNGRQGSPDNQRNQSPDNPPPLP